MFRRSRYPGSLPSQLHPAASNKQRRASKGGLALSLLVNVGLLGAMLHRANVRPSVTQERTVAVNTDSTASNTPREAEELLEGLHSDAAGLVFEMSSWQRAASLAAAAGGRAAGGAKYWLAIGIPTVPRKQANTTYLTATLESLLDELPGHPLDLLYGRVRVLVMNNAPGRHPEFESLRQRAMAGDSQDRFATKAAAYVDFLDNPGTITDPVPDLPEPDDLHNPGDKPGSQVRKQTCDLITLIRHATPLSNYYLFMEDDFEVCPYALRALQYALTKANSLAHLADWLALRVSYGMNGVLMRNADLPPLADFLWRYITEKPPDLLWVEFVVRQARRGSVQDLAAHPTDLTDKPLVTSARRPFIVYKYNLMSHSGTVSSFAVRPDRAAWPGCYASMTNVWSLQMLERFTPRCRHTDLSPCLLRKQGRGPGEKWLQLPLDWAAASQQERPTGKGASLKGMPRTVKPLHNDTKER